MNRRGETTGETSRSPEANPPERQNATKIIYIVYLIVALDVTWMFLQFSVTPVSIYLAGAGSRDFHARSECGYPYGSSRGESDLFTLGICLIADVFYDGTLSVAFIGAVKRITYAVKQARFAAFHQRLNTFRKMRGTSSNFSVSLKNTQLAAKHTRRPFTFTPHCTQLLV